MDLLSSLVFMSLDRRHPGTQDGGRVLYAIVTQALPQPLIVAITISVRSCEDAGRLLAKAGMQTSILLTSTQVTQDMSRIAHGDPNGGNVGSTRWPKADLRPWTSRSESSYVLEPLCHIF